MHLSASCARLHCFDDRSENPVERPYQGHVKDTTSPAPSAIACAPRRPGHAGPQAARRLWSGWGG